MVFRRLVASTVSVCLLGSSFGAASPALAQLRTCADAAAASRGELAQCAVLGTTTPPFAYRKLQWDVVSEQVLTLAPTGGVQFAAAPGSQVERLGVLAAQALNASGATRPVSAADLATAIALFPTNMPFVAARYNPLNAELVIDIFKLQKTLAASGTRVVMLHARFGPEHGEHWQAASAYIDPAARRAGELGKNPFAAFVGPERDVFSNISLPAAQVAVGHAMRMAQAPFAALAVLSPNIRTEKHVKKRLLTKKTTVIWYGEAKPVWYLAMPAHLAKATTSSTQPAFCATDPAAESCDWYAIATAGVVFDQFEGGTLDASVDAWELQRKSQTGLSFVGMVVAGLVMGAAMAAVLPAMGAAGSVLTQTGLQSASASIGGLFTWAGAATATFTASTLGSALALETAFWATAGVLAGGNLSSTFNFSGPLTWNVNRGVNSAPALDALNAKLLARVQAPMRAAPDAQGWATLTGVRATVQGDCALGTSDQACAGVHRGAVQRTDQLLEFDSSQFIRDNAGTVLRTTPLVGQ
jgi:hypothetical protein